MLDAVRDRNAVVLQVLTAGQLEHLWTATGPTLEALRIRDEQGRGVSPETHVWVALAFELFNGTGGLTVSRLLETLEGPKAVIALTLLIRVAMGEPGIQSILESGGEDPDSGATTH